LSGRISSDEFVCILLGANKMKAEVQREECVQRIKEVIDNFGNVKLEFECSVIEWNGETLGEIIEKL